MLMSKEEKTGRTIVRCQRPNDRWKKITKVDRLVWGARIQESDMVILVYHRIKKKRLSSITARGEGILFEYE